MTNFDNVLVGPAGAPDNIRRNERSTADADKFKEEMMRKLSQVNESDAEQQKKRKQQAEEEEDEAIPEPEPILPSQVTPFDLQKQVNPMDLEGGGRTPPFASAQPTEASPAPQTSSYMSAAPERTQADFGNEESASIFNVPQQDQSPTEGTLTKKPLLAAPKGAPDAKTSSDEESGAEPTAPQEEEEGGAKPTAPQEEEEGGEKPTAPQEEIGKLSSSEMLQKGMAGEELDKIQIGSKEEASGLFEKMTQQRTTQTPISPQKKLEELAATDAEGLVTPTPILKTTEGSFEGDQGKKQKEEDLSATTSDISMPTPQLTIGGDVPIAGSSPPPAYTAMNSQVLELFERMVGVMMMMTDSKMTEIVITLNSPQFASSVFYGTQIIIQEYASAPKAFNVQLNGNPEAVALFQGNAADLMAAFQHGNYNFRVNRFETGYLSERPLFHRKEKTSGNKQDQSGSGP